MPFKSEAQRKYMHKNLPLIAQEWENEYSHEGLPERLHPKKNPWKVITKKMKSKLLRKRVK